MGQDANFDLRNYHVYVASALLNGRGSIDVAPGYHASYHNPALYLPLYLGLRWLEPRLFGFLLGSVQSVAFVLLYLFVEGILGRPKTVAQLLARAAMALTGVLGAGNLSELGTTFCDNLLASFVLLALLLLITVSCNQSRSGSSEFVGCLGCGAALGIGVGLKSTFAVYGAGLIAAALAAGGGWWRRSRRAFSVAAGIGAGAALTGGPWAVALYRRYGNPTFPYMNDLFRSPMANRWGYRDLSFVPKSFLDYLASPLFPALSPFRVGEVGFQDWRFIAVLGAGAAVCGCAASRLLRRQPAWHTATNEWPATPLVAFFVVSYVAWYGVFGIYRYAIALEMLSSVLILLAIVRVVSDARWRAVLLCCVFVPLVVTTQPGRWGRCPWGDDFLGIEFPPGVNWHSAMVVVAGRMPVAYLAAALPSDVPLIRVDARGDPVRSPTFPGPAPKLTDLGRAAFERIASHSGPIYLVTRAPMREWKHLLAYDLETKFETCQSFRPHLERRRWLQLCELRRKGQYTMPHVMDFGSGAPP